MIALGIHLLECFGAVAVRSWLMTLRRLHVLQRLAPLLPVSCSACTIVTYKLHISAYCYNWSFLVGAKFHYFWGAVSGHESNNLTCITTSKCDQVFKSQNKKP